MIVDCIFPENDTCKTLVVELCRRFKITTFLLLFSIYNNQSLYMKSILQHLKGVQKGWWYDRPKAAIKCVFCLSKKRGKATCDGLMGCVMASALMGCVMASGLMGCVMASGLMACVMANGLMGCVMANLENNVCE